MTDTDVVSRLQAELELSKRLLADAQALARIGSWEWDLSTNVVTWSDELYRIYGYEPGSVETSYEAFLGRVHPDDRESVDARNRRCFETHEPFEDVKRIVRADGTEFLMRTRGEMVCDSEGTALRMIGVCEDVTDAQLRRRAVDLNDNVIQSLVLASYQLDQDPEAARGALQRAMAECQRVVGELLATEGAHPGALRRDEPALN
jgi:PAS domain S-box-containing protein